MVRRFSGTVSFKADDYVLELLDELCRILDTSKSQVIRYAIIRYHHDVVKGIGDKGKTRFRVKRVVLK